MLDRETLQRQPCPDHQDKRTFKECLIRTKNMVDDRYLRHSIKRVIDVLGL